MSQSTCYTEYVSQQHVQFQNCSPACIKTIASLQFAKLTCKNCSDVNLNKVLHRLHLKEAWFLSRLPIQVDTMAN